MIYKNFLILLLSIFISGCYGSNSYDNSYLSKITESEQYHRELDVHDFASNQTNLPEIKLTIGSSNKNKNYTFGEIKSIKKHDNKLYLLDSKSRQLRIFHLKNGKHVETIDFQGKGPGELLYPEDMIIDIAGKNMFILDAQQKIIQFSLQGHTPILHTEHALESRPENFCLTEDNVIIRSRFSSPRDESEGNIVVYDRSEHSQKKIVGDLFLSDNRLLTDQLSRGTIFCSEEDDNIYSIDRYLPQLTIFKEPDYTETEKILFTGLSLLEITPSFSEERLPVLSYDNSNGAAVVNNVIASNEDIFVQLYELQRTGDEIITTYQLDKKNYSLKKYFKNIGFIHQIEDSLIITSVNNPFPKIEIYKF